MKKIGFLLFLVFSFNALFSQKLQVNVINKTAEIKNEIFHIRANKGDILRFNIQTEIKNEKKGKYYDLKNVKIYRQFASEEFQYIIDKYDVDTINNLDLHVPTDGIYTLIIDRGGLSKFNTTLIIDRLPENESQLLVTRKAVSVIIPDTIHTYTKDSVVYDYIRVSTPMVSEETTLPYYEDQIFMDRAYALRIGDKYAVPIQIPIELYSKYKKQKSVKWGFFISVGDEVYKALQGKCVDVAKAGMAKGVGKMMSGKTDEVTGLVQKNNIQKAYTVFDKAATANEIAAISGDISELLGSKSGEKVSNTVATITGFTGLTDIAMNKAVGYIPRIEDQVIFKLLSQEEYDKYASNQPYVCIKEGKGCFAADTFEITNPNLNYYLILENERKLEGSFIDIAQAVGKTYLSQYVYLSLKVFVQKSTFLTYSKGYYDRQNVPLYNPLWHHTQAFYSSEKVMYEDEVKPYYKVVGSSNTY